MIPRNPCFQRVASTYLFPEVKRRVLSYLDNHPSASLISLSIGDTSEPLPPTICSSLEQRAQQLGTYEGYMGYGPEQGERPLREQIASVFYKGKIDPEEIFISDGAKCDLSRLLLLFGPGRTVACQNPTYPAFVDAALLGGSSLIFLPCTPKNAFFPELKTLPSFDLLYFCSPNNPTGAVATHEQLARLIAFLRQHRALLLFDAAYAGFINDPLLPRSIYEIPGAEEVAIEISSFSKLVGFTGVRLGWTVVPKALRYREGSSIRQDWDRLVTTVFNGASILSQAGGKAACLPQGQQEMKEMIAFYRENTYLLRQALQQGGYEVYGGHHAPYLWVKGANISSWDLFQQLLETKQLVTTPGSGFGTEGEGYLRFSAFGNRASIFEAVERLKV